MSRAHRPLRAGLLLVAVLVTVAAVGLRLGAGSDDASSAPTRVVRNGVLVVLKGEGPLVQRPRDGLGSLPTDVAPYSALTFIKGGRELVYENRDGVFVAFDVRARRWRLLHRCAADARCDVAVSPDGRRIAVGTAAGVRVTDLATHRSFALGTAEDYVRSWSPSGRELLVVDADRDLSRVVVERGALLRKVVELPDRHYPLDPQWSPDGRRIAFFDYAEGQPDSPFGTYTAMLLPLDGSTGPRGLFVAARGCCGARPAPTLVWAPDGSRLLVGSLVDEEQRPVRAFTAEGREVAPPDLVGMPDLVGAAAWQPVATG